MICSTNRDPLVGVGMQSKAPAGADRNFAKRFTEFDHA